MNRIKGLKLAAGLGLGTIASLAIIAPVATTLTQKTNTKVLTLKSNSNVKTDAPVYYNPIKGIDLECNISNPSYSIAFMTFHFGHNVNKDDFVGMEFVFSNLSLPLPSVTSMDRIEGETDCITLRFGEGLFNSPEFPWPSGKQAPITGHIELKVDESDPKFKVNGIDVNEYSQGDFVGEKW